MDQGNAPPLKVKAEVPAHNFLDKFVPETRVYGKRLGPVYGPGLASIEPDSRVGSFYIFERIFPHRDITRIVQNMPTTV